MFIRLPDHTQPTEEVEYGYTEDTPNYVFHTA